MVGFEPDQLLRVEVRPRSDAFVDVFQAEERQEPLEGTEQVGPELGIGLKLGDIGVGQKRGVGVILAALAQREEPLDEVVNVLHILIRERPDASERSPSTISGFFQVKRGDLTHGRFP